MKVVFQPMTQYPSIDNAFALLTLRYRTAFEAYKGIVHTNAELNRTGSKPSEQALTDEERACDELDSARQALLDAAAQAYPTIH